MQALEPRLFRYIWRYSKREQMLICGVVLASLPFYFASLDLPKRIVNDAIMGRAFSGGKSTTSFLDLEIYWPALLGGGTTRLFEGFQLGQIPLLLGLSSIFLALVLINGAFKYWINLSKGVLGERMLRRLRFQLFSLMLRFTPQAQREVKASETATIIRDEVEPIGTFIGDALVVPVFLGTQALTALAFILMQNIWLGFAAAVVVAVQMVLIPRLRREIIVLSRQRQIASRHFAGRVAEVLDGLPAVTANDSGIWERAEIGGRLHDIFDLRLRIYRRKFIVKYLNNLLAQVTPFLFYTIGGLFALHGELNIGQLVAVLVAYRDLPPPLKELIDWDQQRLDVEVKYETIALHFAPHRLRIVDTVDSNGADPISLGSPLHTSALELSDPDSDLPMRWPDYEVPLPARIALLSPGTSHARALAGVLAGLQTAHSGVVRIGAQDLSELSDHVRARFIASAGPNPVLFAGSIRENILYGLRTRPIRDHSAFSAALTMSDRQRRFEAEKTGNPLETIHHEWIDLAALGVVDAAALDTTLLELLGRLRMSDDLYRFGLSALSIVTENEPAGIAMLAARAELRELLSKRGPRKLVIPFAQGAYNTQATIAENLLFGVPRDPSLAGRRLAAEPRFKKALAEHGLLDELATTGMKIARSIREIFSDLPSAHPLFRRFAFIDPEEIPEYMRRLDKAELGARRSADDDQAFLALALPYVEPRQRFGLLDNGLRQRLVDARSNVQHALNGRTGHEIEPYDPGRINPLMSVLDNLLFGRIDVVRANSDVEIHRQVRHVVHAHGLEEGIRRRGMEHQVGNRGSNLTAKQRTKVDLARALLRRPDILIVDGALADLEGGAAMLLDAADHAFTATSARQASDQTIIAVTESSDEARLFDVCLSPLELKSQMREAS